MISQPIKLVVRHRVPSLNELFRMNPWQRRKEKQETQSAMLSAYGAFDHDFATRTIFAQNTLSTACDTLARFLTTAHKTSHSQSASSKYRGTNKERKSK